MQIGRGSERWSDRESTKGKERSIPHCQKSKYKCMEINEMHPTAIRLILVVRACVRACVFSVFALECVECISFYFHWMFICQTHHHRTTEPYVRIYTRITYGNILNALIFIWTINNYRALEICVHSKRKINNNSKSVIYRTYTRLLENRMELRSRKWERKQQKWGNKWHKKRSTNVDPQQDHGYVVRSKGERAAKGKSEREDRLNRPNMIGFGDFRFASATLFYNSLSLLLFLFLSFSFSFLVCHLST